MTDSQGNQADHRPAPSTPAGRGGRPDDHSVGGGLSLRLRLMLILLAVFGAIQVCMSVVWLAGARRASGEVFDVELKRTAAGVAAELAPARGPPADTALAAAAGEHARSAQLDRVTVCVYDDAGKLIACTSRSPVPHVAPGEGAVPVAVATASPVAGSSAAPSEKVSGRAASAEFTAASDGRRYVVVAGAPDAAVRALADRFARQVVVTTPIGLIAASLAGWLIAGIAVRPLRRLSQIARGLRPDTLNDPILLGSSARELTKLQDELDDMRHRLEAGYAAQERFVANVSHEIKTPIATVLTEAQTLPKGGGVPGEVRKFIDSTQDEMRRLGRLVESFLMLTRVRHGKPLETTTRTVGVNDLVMDSLQHCWKTAEQHGVRLSPELYDDADRDLTVRGDPDLLRTMVDNLIRNAIRFSPRGQSVDVCVRATSAETQLCVRDRGPGIPEHLLPKIFDRFSQAKSEEKLGRGSGLGLEIAQGIAELHGGKISVGNAEGGGCEFCAVLPILAGVVAEGNAGQPQGRRVESSAG